MMYNQPYRQPFFMEGMPPCQVQSLQSPEYSPAMPTPTPTTTISQPGVMGQADQLPVEQSYIENILRLNRGKLATVYMTFDGDQKVFTGIIEAAGRDHIVLSDPQTGKRYLLLMVYLNYVTFDEEIVYSYPLGQMATYSPR
ncbi:spore coat protein GerQ [Pseudogracilibacillus auburnensis]|uniref:spore coat protein GerQ n=1 Tax=Pseudogracilibacillus auburnensis TaxID=1494959 RepID=UPI001A960535|nr:spore coat protein GerQ [Pseudogracilibacillus auburnensis]